MAKRKKGIESSAARARRELMHARISVPSQPQTVLEPKVAAIIEPQLTYEQILSDIAKTKEHLKEIKSRSMTHHKPVTAKDYPDEDERVFVNNIIRREGNKMVDEFIYDKKGPERFFELMQDGFACSSVVPYRGKER